MDGNPNSRVNKYYLTKLYHKGEHMEIKMRIEDSELIITDTYGSSLYVTKYERIDGMGIITERLQIQPEQAVEHDNCEDLTIDMPIEEFDSMIAFIKDRYLIDGKEVDVNV